MAAPADPPARPAGQAGRRAPVLAPALAPVRAPMRAPSLPAALLLAALGAALLPVLLTPVLPVRDGYLHAVRYLVLSGVPLPPVVEASYEADWRLLPNLGMDVIGAGLMRLLDPLLAMKAVGALTILAPLGGVLALSAALHGRPTAPAALAGGVLAVNHVTIWGFTNFLVGLGMALGGIALWLALAGRPRAQMAAALLFGPPLLLMHGLAFGLWGLGLGAVEIGAAWQGRASGGLAPGALARRTLRLLALAALPLLLWSRMPTGEAAALTGYFHLGTRGEPLADRASAEIGWRLYMLLVVGETGWRWADLALGAAFWGLLGLGLRRGALALHPLIAPAAIGAALLVALTPSYLIGVAYVGDRAPLLLACVLAAGCRVRPGARGARAILAGLALLLLADAALTAASWRNQGRHYAAFLEATRGAGLSGTAMLLHRGEAGLRGGGTALACDPLGPLLALTGDVAVPTFDDPTQQPLRLAGRLAAPAASFFALRDLPESGRDVAGLGFDHVIVCEGGPARPRPDEGRPVLRGERWYLLGPERG